MIIDFETASCADLSKEGTENYLSHPTTFVLCAGMLKADSSAAVWLHPRVAELLPAAWLPGDIAVLDTNAMHALWQQQRHWIAHNAYFDRQVQMKFFGHATFPKQWSCTLARAAAENLPLSLNGIAWAIDLSQKKAKADAMQAACRLDDFGDLQVKGDVLLALVMYCIQDLRVTEALHKRLPELSTKEKEVWSLDQKINLAGITADIAFSKRLKESLAEAEVALLSEFKALTGGAVESPRQVAALQAWLKTEGVYAASCTKQALEEVLQGEVSPKARRALEIRQCLGASSLAKVDTLLATASKTDSRIRGMFQYAGATSTGRWSGRGLQPHNLPRETLSDDAWDAFEHTAGRGDSDIFASSKKAIRGLLVAAPGKALSAGDFASIEARVLAWLAGEQEVLEAFQAGLDLYKVAAEKIYKVKYNDIDAIQRQIGKVAMLALGYQGGVKAFEAMAKSYGVKVPQADAEVIVQAWRASRLRTCSLWRALNAAAIAAVEAGDGATPKKCGRLALAIRKGRLLLRLPSGRFLVYQDPKIVAGDYGEKVEFSATGLGGLWQRHDLYGGLLTANATQAVARDILAEAMLRVDAAGYSIVLHVHDEIVVEVPEGKDRLADLLSIMSKPPTWAEGLPIEAEGWTGRRYQK